MGWDKGRYDTRSRKVNGRVVREYYGAGEAAELAAQIDPLDRADREAEREARRAEKAELEALNAASGNFQTAFHTLNATRASLFTTLATGSLASGAIPVVAQILQNQAAILALSVLQRGVLSGRQR